MKLLEREWPLGRPRRKWKDNVKKMMYELCAYVWNKFILLRL
jgi:hypothetical protein